MFRSVPAGQWLCAARQGIARAVCAAAAAGIALTTTGLTGTSAVAAAAAAARQTTGPPIYTANWAGYQAGGDRWFRFVSTTLTVPDVTNGGDHSMADIALNGSDPNWFADITVVPGGGPGSVLYQDPLTNFFNLSPDVGDQLAISIFYDQHGHNFYTATDLTQGTAQTVRAKAGSPVYTTAWLRGLRSDPLDPPLADIRLWHFTGSHLTTYTGVHGTILGPWTTSELIATTDGTASGEVLMSPSSLRDGGQNFGVWLRHP
jgi:hypothetical protein